MNISHSSLLIAIADVRLRTLYEHQPISHA